jgi:hypothetical protein
MSGQHTPGPWQVNGSHVYGGGSPERASLIAQVLSPDPRHLADRSLIAAAPDLYEALRTVLDYREGRHPYRFTGSDETRASDAFDAWQDVETKVRAALAKARGEA